MNAVAIARARDEFDLVTGLLEAARLNKAAPETIMALRLRIAEASEHLDRLVRAERRKTK